MDTQIIQFSAGRGPSECAWVVAKVLKIFIHECQSKGIEYIILNKQNGNENGTVQSVTLKLEGKKLSELLLQWEGTIQWIGQSNFRKYHKRKNWFIGCFPIKMNDKTTIHDSEIQYQAVRSSGPGGQHVNKVSSAIRAIHKPSNIQVLVMDSRSQHQNKKIAKQRLVAKIEEQNLLEITRFIENQWENHLNLKRGNPVKVFYGTDFKKKETNKTFKQSRKAEKQKWQKQI